VVWPFAAAFSIHRAVSSSPLNRQFL